MATHPTAIRNGIVDYVVDQLDTGTTNSSARIVFQTSANAEVATLNMDGTAAFGDATNGVATANSISDDTSATGGVMTKAVLNNKDNTTIINATVGTSGTDFITSNTTIPAGGTVRVVSLTYTAPN